jgi:aminopeptidase N
MATKATGALHPEWQPELDRVSGREGAMALDAVATTHPIVQRIQTVDQISQAFDSITYNKGEAVITMLEDYVGEDAWRRGVQDYMRTYRLKNTVTDNLWQKVEAPPVHSHAIAHDFTLQPGVPLIRVENATCSGGRTNVTLGHGGIHARSAGQAPLSWRVPVIARPSADQTGPRTSSRRRPPLCRWPGCGFARTPPTVNSGTLAAISTLYTPALLEAPLPGSFAQLQTIRQIGSRRQLELRVAGHSPAVGRRST